MIKHVFISFYFVFLWKLDVHIWKLLTIVLWLLSVIIYGEGYRISIHIKVFICKNATTICKELTLCSISTTITSQITAILSHITHTHTHKHWHTRTGICGYAGGGSTPVNLYLIGFCGNFNTLQSFAIGCLNLTEKGSERERARYMRLNNVSVFWCMEICDQLWSVLMC